MMEHSRKSCLFAVVLLIAARGVLAGLVVSTDSSDLCNSNMKECTQRCPPPQNFVFMCNSGGTFSQPQSDCKCITPPPVGVVTDGSAVWQMVQWPGAEPCQGNTWLYDCAQYMTMNAMSNTISAQAVDQASAMAAVAAAKAQAEAQAAQAAQMAAMMAQQQQQGAQAGSPSSVPGMGAAPGVPGMDPTGGASMNAGSGMGPASAPAMFQTTGPSASAASMSPGMGMGMGASTGMGMGAGSGMMGAQAALAGANLMSAGSMGRRHLLQFGAAPVGMDTPMGAGAGAGAGAGGAGAGAGGAAGAAGAAGAGVGARAGGAAAGVGALPTTQLGPACQKNLQGVVTGVSSGALVIPNFKGVGTITTRGNDTMMIQLGGQGSQCVAGYKLMGGKVLDVGRTKEEVAKQQEAAKKSSAATAAPAWGLALLLGAVIAVLL